MSITLSYKSMKRNLLYIIPISLLLGTNVPMFDIGGRTIYLGTNELIILIFYVIFIFDAITTRVNLKFPEMITWGILFFSFAIIFSKIINIFLNQHLGSLSSYIEVVRWFEYLSVFFIVLIYAKSINQVNMILKVMFYCVALSILYSAYQAATFNFAEQRIYGLFVSGADRVDESISNPNVVGVLFMGTSLIFLSFSIRKKFKNRFIFRLFLIPSIIVLILTLSRSSFLGFITGSLFIMFGYRKKMLTFISTSIIIIGVLFLLASSFKDVSSRFEDSINLTSDTASSVAILDRWSAWNLTLKKIPENIWFGIGYGDFENGFGFLTPDNQYIEFMATIGVVGITAYIYMLFSILYKVLRLDCRRDNYLHALKFAYIGIFLGLLVANITGNMLANPRILGLFWLLTALVLRAFNLKPIETAPTDLIKC